MDGIPPERMVTDSWPALNGRPVLRRTVAVSLVLCVSVAAALVVRGVNALTLGGPGHETDRDRAERLAGLHPSQHPGVGRYYVPVGAVYTHTSDGAPVAYLHYRLGGGRAPGVGDFLSAYDLPDPGPAAPLPPDLVAALGGDEPAEAPELSEGPVASSPSSASSAPASPSGSPTPPEPPVPSPDPAGPSAPGAPGLLSEDPPDGPSTTDGPNCPPATDGPDGPAPEAAPSAVEAAPEGEPVVTAPAAAAPAAVPIPAPTLTPGWPASAAPTHAPSARRIYVATIPGGLPGAADIYIRATG
ncbi:hypothetical protein [Streptomyces sp. 1331.2]|uniref:hypothetical protein n=1 Tax=Streptomyces sp. 1331.2 TaxID=1938835 RepID=UPI000BCADE67|nr:hypothetical protein [Streptomyces sp. 1331.2]SOB81511.1 hypothetical protein SAMN06272789_1647 [Streptomyces sp. 1331.2]